MNILKACIFAAASICVVSPVHSQTLDTPPLLLGVGMPNTAPAQEVVVQPDSTTAEAPQATTVRVAPRRLRFGPELGLFVPTRNLVRDRFGVNWFSFGLGLGQYESAPMGGHYNIDVSLMSHSSSSNAAYLLPVGIEYRRGLAEDKPTIPYVATVLDVVPTDIRSITDNVSWGIRTGYAYGLFAGLDIGNNARLEGGYRWFTDIAGYNFSGAYLSAGFRF